MSSRSSVLRQLLWSATLLACAVRCGPGDQREGAGTPAERVSATSDGFTFKTSRQVDGSFQSTVLLQGEAPSEEAFAQIGTDGYGVLEHSRSGLSTPLHFRAGPTDMINAQLQAMWSLNAENSPSAAQSDLACSSWSGGACCCGGFLFVCVACTCCGVDGACGSGSSCGNVF